MNKITRARRFRRERFEALGVVDSPAVRSTLCTIVEGRMVHRVSQSVLEHWQAPRQTRPPALVEDAQTTVMRLTG